VSVYIGDINHVSIYNVIAPTPALAKTQLQRSHATKPYYQYISIV
jgi:hypothetical protein